MTSILEGLMPYVPAATTLVLVVVGLFVAQRVLQRWLASPGRTTFRTQLTMLALTAVGAVLFLMVLPIGDTFRGQLLGFFGILLSAAIALSSTTFLGNAMAGVLLRVVRNFRVGDFIACGDHFGRVTERGLFHTEVQNESRELVTLPNLFLITHPVTTTRTSGTIVAATVSLGYDVERSRVETLLLAAGKEAGLEDPFVHVVDLGDFSVTYRVAGLLGEVKRLLTARSRLRACMLDGLHAGGVEIVSPSFMNTRAFDPKTRFVPRAARTAPDRATPDAAAPEAIVFDKAEEAESLVQLEERWEQARKIADEFDERVESEKDEARIEILRDQALRARAVERRLHEQIESRKAAEDERD